MRDDPRPALDLTGVEAFLLDVGGVLLVPETRRLAEVLVAHGGTDQDTEIVRAHFGAMAAADDGTGFDPAVYERELLRRCAVTPARIDACRSAYSDAFGAVNLWQQPIIGATEAVAALHAAGYRLAIVSNSDGTVERSLAATGICQRGPGAGTAIDVILDSQVVGSQKPDALIFRTALDRLGLGPEQVVHVGDTRFADVAGAVTAGIRPLHIDPFDDCPQPADHPHLQNLAEPAAVIG